MKPYAEACERNRGPILDVLARVFADRTRVLEIGSGTGQHAVFMAEQLTHLVWQTSDLAHCHPGIRAWIADVGLANVRAPIELDVHQPAWPAGTYDAIFSANVVHIVSWPAVQAMFAGIGRHLEPDGLLALYGPFNYAGTYTSESNRSFDAWLRARDPASGIRDFEALDALARDVGLVLIEDNAMPANNRLLVWRRSVAR